jgi:hypothetical protein
MCRVNPQTGQVATFVSWSTTRNEVQPFVLQYGRLAVDERRRILRIATDRPATDAVVVRVIISGVCSFWDAFRGRSLRRSRQRGLDFRSLFDGSMSGAGAT